MSITPNVYAKARSEIIALFGWNTDSLSPEQSLRLDCAVALRLALDRPYVVQERAALKKIPIPTFGDRARIEEMFVDFNPFLFHNEAEGALVRLSSSSLLNVTSGGGQTALLVLEDM